MTPLTVHIANTSRQIRGHRIAVAVRYVCTFLAWLGIFGIAALILYL